MSILAGQKRRVRYNLNPQGNIWANDSNTFGKKMLEKMGWSDGKGLGANLDGMRTVVKVQYKDDQVGVGFKDKNDQWTEHEDKFAALLKNLQAETSHTVIADDALPSGSAINKSLELKSKASRSRVHYKKFTRGKDLTRYSSQDLANIFGRKSLEKMPGPEPERVVSESHENETEVKRHGVLTLNGGSMTDYFKKKMSSLMSTFSNRVKPEVEDEEDGDERPSFGFGFQGFQQPGEDVEPCEERVKEDKKSKKRKHREENEEFWKKAKIDGVANEGFEVVGENGVDSGVSVGDNSDESPENEIKPKNKKKNKKLKESGVENPSFDFNGTIDGSTEVVAIELNPYEVANDTNKRKKKKKKNREQEQDDGLVNPSFDVIEEAPVVETILTNPYEVPAFEEKTRKKKKKNDKQETVILPTEETNMEDIQPKKKKKKKRSIEAGIDNPTFEERTQEEEVVVEETPKKKKKSKKTEPADEVSRDEEADYSIQEVLDESVVSDIADRGHPNENEIEKPKKKKKKKSTIVIEATEEIEQSVSTPSTPNTPVTPTTPISSNNNFGISDDLIMNICVGPEPKPILHTPQSEKRLKRRKSVRINESLNQEHIIPNVLLQKQLEQKNELFDINNAVLERSQDSESNGFTNGGFDPLSADDGHYNNTMEQRQHYKGGNGINNPVFSNMQEEMQDVEKSLEHCQAEVENDINETKQRTQRTAAAQPATPTESMRLPNGNALLVNGDGRSYSHRARGHCSVVDPETGLKMPTSIEMMFKNSSLHAIDGYGTTKSIIRYPSQKPM